MLLTVYFFVLGVLAVAHVLAPLVSPFMPQVLKEPFALDLIRGEGEQKKGKTILDRLVFASPMLFLIFLFAAAQLFSNCDSTMST